MQQAYKFTRIVPRDSNQRTRFIAVQYLRVPRTIIYDAVNTRSRTPYALATDGIWECGDASLPASAGIGPNTHVLADMSEQEFFLLAHSDYANVMARMHCTPESLLEQDRRWESVFMHRYGRMVGLPPALPNNSCRISGRSVSPGVYMRLRRHRKVLAAAIAARDAGDVFDCLQSMLDVFGGGHTYIIERAMDAINDMDWVDDNIVLTDCGHLSWNDETNTVEGEQWCQSCFQDDAVYVEHRDEYMRRDNVYEHSDGNYYTYEEDEELDEDEDEDDDEPRRLMGYSTNVMRHLVKDDNIKSSPFGDFLMGVELEMCAGSRRTVDDAVSDVLSQLGDGYCVCKSDGSLPDDGLEIVTAPRGLAEHIDRFKNWNINPSYRAWNSGKCGVHVHIDARAFSQLTLGKFLIFINAEDNKDFIRKIAGRHPAIDNQAQRYCAMEGQEQLTNPKQALKGKDSNRYYMVNLSNLTSAGAAKLGLPDWKFSGRYNTVELRIFRASLKKERLLAQLEFTHAAVMFVRAASYRELTGGAFVTWLKKYSVLYPHLAAWYGVAPIKKANPNAAPAVVSSDETVST
jgi:hypothetical protein